MTDSLLRRSAKPTIQIPARTVAECAARYAAMRACEELGLPCDLRLDR